MIYVALLCLMIAFSGGKQNSTPPAAVPQPSRELDSVLNDMDQAAANFSSAQADFEWDNYQKVVDETDKQTGKVYFRRKGASVEAMFNITAPAAKQVLFEDDKLRLYNPKLNQITEYKLSKSSTDVDAFLSLGFGASGHGLLKSYDVQMAGWETVDGVRTAKLELTAHSPKVRNMFSQFVLWIDPRRDVPIKQQVIEPSGDYWLSHYTGFDLTRRIPDQAFKISASHPQVVSPQ